MDLKDCIFETPCYLLDEINGNRIFIKREDMIPYSFGGNKFFIALKYYEDMIRRDCDCMVAYGNPNSNLCRILSTICYMKGIKCVIVSPSKEHNVNSLNRDISVKLNAEITICSKDKVSDTMSGVLGDLKKEGFKPYYIYGDIYGEGNERVPVTAYVERYTDNIRGDIVDKSIDCIVLPCGTGMTMAGLAVGRDIKEDKVDIIGISVARSADSAMKYFQKYYDSYEDDLRFVLGKNDTVIIDDYICGGYGEYDKEIASVIDNMYGKYGIPMDPTYTGKGFYGMLEWIKKQGINGKNIMFIHTGGTPLWFDYMVRGDVNNVH